LRCTEAFEPIPVDPDFKNTNRLWPDLSIPYGFPKPGLYRIFLQFKRVGRIETASFDAHVQ
jgi:hypothetical protein